MDRDSRVEVIRVLVLVEAAIAVVMALESLFAFAFAGPAAGPVVIASAMAAGTTLWVVRGVRLRSRWSRRVAVSLQIGILGFAVIDTVVAIVVAQRGLELVPMMSRVVLPIAILRLLRKPDVRTEFGVRLSRRQRRRSANAAEVAA